MRQRVLDEAWALAAENGWDRVRVADLAQRADVSRPSIYAEFGDRAGVGHALVHRESDRFLTGLGDVLERHRTHVGFALQAGVGHVLAEAERDPFIKAVLSAARGGTDALLPFLTSRPEPILTAAWTLVSTWLDDVLPQVEEGRRAEAADLLVRLSISHMLLPLPEPGTAPARLARAACAVLGIRPQE
ncbi:TetR family transcriptional regulator [Streptomyces sp. NPDC056738]|uniref:TetR/AcrR family transcriptional regulator n=1 Tax=Streptomyces sp. NPDC056738 TaxID=3345933 RepID=UPI0036A6FD6D